MKQNPFERAGYTDWNDFRRKETRRCQDFGIKKCENCVQRQKMCYVIYNCRRIFVDQIFYSDREIAKRAIRDGLHEYYLYAFKFIFPSIYSEYQKYIAIQ